MEISPRRCHREFQWPVRVYYEDTDSAGMVYYANYLKFMERARTEWLRALGFEQTTLREEHNALFVVSRLKVDYRVPARFNDALTVDVRLLRRGPASLQLGQHIHREPRELLCRGEVRIACLHADSLRPHAIPPPLCTELERDP